MKYLMRIKEIFVTFFLKRLLVKLVLFNATVIIALITITFNLISSNFITSVQENEIKKQDTIIQNVGEIIDIQYDNINKLMIHIYTDDKLKIELREIMNDENKLPQEMHNIDSFVKGIFQAEPYILDLLFIRDGQLKYFQSSYRSPSIKYNFNEDDILKQPIDSKSKVKVDYDAKTDYILYDFNSIITFHGNIYNPDKFPNRIVEGKFAINVSLDYFQRKINSHLAGFYGTVFIINEDGVILYDSSNLNNGKRMSSYKELKNFDDSIINSSYLDSGMEIVVVTPGEVLYQGINEIKDKLKILIIICIAGCIGITTLILNSVKKRIMYIVMSMKELQKGDLNTRIRKCGQDEIGFLAISFNQMVNNLKKYIDRVYKAEIRTKNVELSNLQAKINPHFLNNTLELIRMKSLENNDRDVSDMIQILGKIFNWNVRGNCRVISLEEELEYIYPYIDLYKKITDKYFDFSLNIDSQTLKCGVLKLLLQPIIENSFYHGFIVQSGGEITISSAIENNKLIIVVKDNGIGMKEENLIILQSSLEKSNTDDQYHIGLSNVHMRLVLSFGEEYGLKIESKENEGTAIKLILPVMDKEVMSNYVQTSNS